MSSATPRKTRPDFIARTLAGLLKAVESSLLAEKLARADGLLQKLDARVNVLGLLLLIVATAMARNLWVIGGMFGVSVALAVLSRVPLRTLAVRQWIGVFVFTSFVALPAIFITPGDIIYRVPILHWHITAQGVRSALYLVTRVETSATLALLLVLCTPWTRVLKALRVLRVPIVFVVILGMTYRYIFLLMQSAQELFEARRSRLVGPLDGANRRRLAMGSAGVLLSRSLHLSGEVYLAMQSRGFRGEVYTLDEPQMRPRDWFALGLFVGVAALGLWLGRFEM